MSPSVEKIGPESDVLLRNLFEHYVHDMAVWFEIDTKADGSYSYDTSSIWTNGFDVYVVRLGESIAGFAIVGPAEDWLGGGHDMHEFFVIRRFRGTGLGQGIATAIWNKYPGPWLVRVAEVNEPAAHFWRNAISRYASGAYTEEARIVNGRGWKFFQFTSNGRSGLESEPDRVPVS